MTIKNLYPSVRPTLDLNFAQTKQLDPRITFSRSSSGTYFDANGVLRSASTNQARFDHDPSTGESLGLLVEEARTNYVTDNNQVLLAVTNSTTSSAPGVDGVATSGSRITSVAAGAASARNATNRTIFWPDSSYTVWSFSVKPENTTATSITLSAVAGAGAGGATFDWSTLTTTINGVNASGASIKAMGNGWYRCSVNYGNTLLGSSGYRADFNFTAGAAGDAVVVYGLQVEVGTFPTSYIPTAGSTVTRAADVAQITGTNFSGWYNQSEGTIATDLIPSTVGSLAIWTVSDGTTSERMLSYTGTTFSFYVQDGGVSQVQYDAGGYTAGVPRKAASAFATNNFNYARDGVVNTTDTSGSLPTVDRLQLMAGHSGGQIQSGHLRRFTFYPVRLSDATLRALTL